MDFDCWTGLRIEGKPYIVAEKIHYKEKTSDDVWTEYGLITTESNARTWLSISDGGLSCSLSTAAVGSKPPRGYRLHDAGTEVVTGVWGDTDASVGDEAKYEQYESADGTETFFVENWNGTKSSSAGRKISAADIIADETSAAARLRNLTFSVKEGFFTAVGYVAIIFGVFSVLSLIDGVTDLDTRDWHSFRSFVGLPYALHERLSDAPWYTEQQEEGGARIYTAQTDAGTVALDLIEGVEGDVQDVTLDAADAETALVLRAHTEIARIVPAPDGTAHIVLTDTGAAAGSIPMPPPAETYRDPGAVLLRYAALVRTGDARGRTAVLAEEATAPSVPAPAPAAAQTTAAPEQPAQSADGTPRRNLHLAH